MDPITALTRTGRTRKELRRMVGMRLGDLLVLTATANASSPTTFIDTTNLNDDTDYYAGRYAYFCGGQVALRDQTRYVQASSRDQHALTFSQALPVTVKVGDELHLVNWSGVGFTPSDYHDAMNSVIDSAGSSHFFIPMRVDVDQSFNATDNTITLPEEMVFVDNVESKVPEGAWESVTAARDGSTNGWYIDEPTASIVLEPPSYPPPSYGLPKMRVTGYGVPSLLTTDDSTMPLPTEWFVEETCARMLEKNIQLNPGMPNRDRIYSQLRGHADAIRPTLTVRLGTHTKRVR